MRKEYTITELEKLTGFSRRTIHFYIKEGLIPPPGSVGAGAKYGEEHLLRLKMTAILQKRDMKLNGIRKILDSMPLEDIKVTVAEEEAKTASRGLTGLFAGAYSLRSMDDQKLTSDSISPQYYMQKTDPGLADMGGFLMNKAVLQVSEPKFMKYMEEESKNIPVEIPEKEEEHDSIEAWRHIELIDGIQMNIREDIFHKYRSLIGEMIKKFKEQ